MKKLEQVFVEDENGDFNAIERSAFLKLMIEENSIEDFKLEDGVYPKDKVAEGILEEIESSGDIELDGEMSELQPVADWTKEKVEASLAYVSEKADEKKKEAEEKKAAKEKEKAEKAEREAKLAKSRDNFLGKLKSGADKAKKAFEGELNRFKKAIPTGVSIAQNDSGGFGLEFDENVTEAQIGAATGYFLQQKENSEFMQHTAGFFVGELCNRLVSSGMYVAKMKAANAIAEKVEEVSGKKPHPRGIESYARMAERIPIDYRNSKVSDKAYLELSNAKKAKKAKDEDKDDFKEREKAYEAERLEIAESLKSGDLSDVKDVKKRIDEMQIKHGVKAAPDPDKKSAGDYLKTFFLGTQYIDKLEGVHESGKVVFQEKGSKSEYAYDVSELKEMVEEARLNLTNALIGFKNSTGAEINLDDLIEGSKEMDVPELDLKGKPTGNTSKESVKVFPRPFFDIPKSEGKEEEGEEEGSSS